MMYGPRRLVTELTRWMGDRFELSVGGLGDARERDLSHGRTDTAYRSGSGGRDGEPAPSHHRRRMSERMGGKKPAEQAIEAKKGAAKQ